MFEYAFHNQLNTFPLLRNKQFCWATRDSFNIDVAHVNFLALKVVMIDFHHTSAISITWTITTCFSYLCLACKFFKFNANLWVRDKGLTKNLQKLSSGVCLSYSARCFTSVLTRGKSAAIMVNLTYVRRPVGRQGMPEKFSFAVTCFYSLEKWRSLP